MNKWLDTIELHELALWNTAECYEKLLKHLHLSPVALIQNIQRLEESLQWLSVWKVSGKGESLPWLPTELAPCCWTSLLAAEPLMPQHQQRASTEGLQKMCILVSLSMLSLVSCMKMRLRAWTLVFCPWGSASSHHLQPSHRVYSELIWTCGKPKAHGHFFPVSPVSWGWHVFVSPAV